MFLDHHGAEIVAWTAEPTGRRGPATARCTGSIVEHILAMMGAWIRCSTNYRRLCGPSHT